MGSSFDEVDDEDKPDFFVDYIDVDAVKVEDKEDLPTRKPKVRAQPGEETVHEAEIVHNHKPRTIKTKGHYPASKKGRRTGRKGGKVRKIWSDSS